MTGVTEYPARQALNDEVHARPPEPLPPAARISFLAQLSPLSSRAAEIEGITDLCHRLGAQPPEPGPNHYSLDLGPFRLIWERHTEFTRYTFIAPPAGSSIPVWEQPPALSLVPDDWLQALPGQRFVATHATLVAGATRLSHEEISATLFRGNQLVGAMVAGGAAFACTDFRIHEDGFSRLLIEDHGLTRRQAGRTLQRLLEIDSYRMMALLALPVAQQASPYLSERERTLTDIAAALVGAKEADEPSLLRRLTELEAQLAERTGETGYRFAAASAYHDLVRRRIAELREERVGGLQTFHEFIERRLAPAMGTCRSIAARQDALTQRAARTTQLLAIRVDLTREHQNQDMLRAMNRRADAQLRLQSTIESLSVAAVTYYLVGLVGYAAKFVSSLGVPVTPEVAMGCAVPVAALISWLGIRRIHRLVTQSDGPHP